jgi:hypothetical protein
MKKLIFWEMNEINFDFVHYYISIGKLKNWEKFINAHGIYNTTSESIYENIEPWIQWPTIRTGLPYSDHGVFRLGDFGQVNIKQHWEIIEQEGFTVAAISPINAVNNTLNSPFWIPDPWLDTKVSGGGFERRISCALKQAVNDNANKKLSFSTTFALIEALITRGKVSSFSAYIKGLFNALIKRRHWSKALILDRLISDIFISLWLKNQPDFSVMFLNSGAHIQHHYMFNSEAYKGQAKNPEWYVKKGLDPLLDILELYDKILEDLLKIPNTRLMISVGMRQIPYEKNTYYWRLKNHVNFLKKLGISFRSVLPRMTRDFLIEFSSKHDALAAEKVLSSLCLDDGEKIFGEIDNRGLDIFVTLTYSNEISSSMSLMCKDIKIMNFKSEVVFVAIKNGHHDQQGYFLDNGLLSAEVPENFEIKHIFSMVMKHFNINRINSLDSTKG